MTLPRRLRRSADSSRYLAIRPFVRGGNHSMESRVRQIGRKECKPQKCTKGTNRPWVVFCAFLWPRLWLVSGYGPGGTGADWTLVVLAMGAGECLIDAGVDVALRLATYCRQLRNYQIT